ncbi:Cupredoxin [Kockovaella imperatae]|uniref:Cupredoxin n=1 Tax=Kockovaella imperatae TaxID=4999 RepID=A0A1Y1UL84_9TREE|nr:Cupredoxin [Kockovaella imperatae]ORX38813.1 Cupredoxin [Kockovaella imperatae]
MVIRPFVLAVALAGQVSAVVQEHWWNISYATANPDGLYERRVIGVNGTWPIPAVHSIQGDEILIHAYNGLGEVGTSLHAHGMFFNHSNWYDGAVGVTQCSLPPGQTMDYSIDTSLQNGTYWIHAHFSGQYVDGLRTPSVIHSAAPRTDNVTWDDEYTLVVSDWYHEEHPVLLKEFMSWKNPTGAEPIPDSAVIYVLHNDTYYPSPESISNGSATNNNAKIHFEPGQTYRIRIVNMGALAMFWVNFDQHDMFIIEADGVEMDPYPIDVLTVAVAQRYSILVKAKNETGTNYALSVMQSPDMYDYVPDKLVLNNTLQIVYADSNPPAHNITFDSITTLNDTEFVPVIKKGMLPADHQITLNVFFDTYDDGTNRASFNNITYVTPPNPSIFTAWSMGNDSLNPAVYGAQTHALTYPHLANVELTVYNWDSGFHPFHLHGHEFQVVHKSFDVTSNDTTINPPFDENQANPSRRDTITIPPTGSVTLRWTADNPGAWFFHCHIDWHLSSGLAVVMIEAPEYFQSQTIPEQLYDQCKYWDLPTSGNVVGLNSTTDFKGQPWGPFPIIMGWTPKAIGALVGCIITAIVGFLTVVWYGHGGLDESEIEEEVRRKMAAKGKKAGLFKKFKGRSTEGATSQ